jgi:hypothetical protein
MDEKYSVELLEEDIGLLLEVMEKINCQGKSGAIQLLRIMNALEKPISSNPKS